MSYFPQVGRGICAYFLWVVDGGLEGGGRDAEEREDLALQFGELEAKVPAQVEGESLEGLEQRFRRRCEGRKRGEQIPSVLWDAAVGVAGAHGVRRVANKLRLDYGSLNRRVEGEAQADKAGTAFVEMFAATPAVAAAVMRECVIELENARGAKMRVELNGAGLAGLAHLCRGFWSAA